MTTLEQEQRNTSYLTANPMEDVDPHLRVQAQEIIDDILRESPSEAAARALLELVAEDPERPERALLIHLMTFSRP